jgi:hypothetical protein
MKPSAKIGHNSKRRSLDVIADEIHALDRNAFDIGAKLIEAYDQCEHGDWLQWLEEEFDWSVDTAERYMRAARLADKFRTVRNLRVPMTIIYDLAADIEDPDLPAIIEALALASKSKKLSAYDTNEVIELARLRIRFGDYPSATLLALDTLSDDEWGKQASEKLKELRPTTDEEADRIIASHRPPEPEPETVDPTREESAEKEEEEEAAASSGNGHDPETDDDHTGPSLQAEKAKIVRAWCDASSGAKLEFVRERWDEICTARKQLDAAGDDWVEGDDAR